MTTDKEKKKEYDRAHYLANKEKKKMASKQNYQDNKEQKLQCHKKYYEENKEKLLEYGKQYRIEYYKDNNKEILEKQKDYYNSNKNEISKKRSEIYFSNIEERRLYNRKQYYKHFIKALVLGIKNRTKKSKLNCDIDLDFINELIENQNNKCILTGIDFQWGEDNFRKSYRRPFAPSIDRIDCNKGYTKDNVRVVCVIVNLALSDFGDVIFDQMCSAYISNKRLKK